MEIRRERWHIQGKITDDSYALLNAIRLIVFLNTGTFVKLNKMHFVSSKYDYE